MKLLRNLLFSMSLLLLTAGYAASQYAYWMDDFRAYAVKVDVPPIQSLALFILIMAVVLPCLKSEPSGEKQT